MNRLMAAILVVLTSSAVAPAEEPITAKVMLNKAFAAAQSIRESARRADVLAAIGEAQADAGDASAARATLKEAMDAAKEPGDPTIPYTLEAIVEAQVKAADIAGAVATAGMIDVPWLRTDALLAVAAAQTKAGDAAAAGTTFQQALDAAASIKGAWHAETLAAIAAAQAEAGNRSAAEATFQQALEVAASLARAGDHAGTLATIAGLQAKVGDRSAAEATLRQALAAAESIEEASSRSYALPKIAKAQASLGDRSGAEAIFRQALIATELIEDSEKRRLALMRLAETQSEAGDRAGTARTLQRARAMALTIGDPRKRDGALRDVAAVQAGVDVEDEPIAFYDALSMALTSLGGRKPMIRRWRHLRPDPLAVSMKWFGLAEGASTGWDPSQDAAPPGDIDAAIATAMAIENPRTRLTAIEIITAPWLAARDFSALQAPTHELLAALKNLEDGAPGALGAGYLASYYITLMLVAAGDTERPLALAKTLVELGLPGYLFAAIAWAQAEMGDMAGAESTLQEVPRELPTNSKNPAINALREQWQQQLLCLIALAQANTGDMAGALATTDGISDAVMRAETLIAIATDEPPVPDFRWWAGW